MTSNSKIFVGLSTKAQKPTLSGPKCHWDGCDRIGQHKAPVGQEAEGLFFLFCLEHVKDYNRGYNYSSALSSPEVARYQREAAAGNRKSIGTIQNAGPEKAPLPSTARSGSAKAVNARRSAEQRKSRETEQQKRKLKVLEARAFEILGLSEEAGAEEIRDRYKNKIKMLHPDVNGGDRSSEEQLQATIDAYKILKLNGFC